MSNLVKISEAAKLLGVSLGSLRSWESAGKIKPVYTLGGHRRYKRRDIEQLLKGENK